VITISRTQLIAGLVALAIIGSGAALLLWPSTAASPAKVDLRGTLTLHGKTLHDGAGLCMGQGGYSDITEGAPVTVYDGKGAIIATGQLSRGDDRGWKPTDDTERSNTCWFAFTVTAPHSEFYQVEVSHRGKVTTDSDQVELTLGG
jgi:hypothetical protein